MNSAIQSALEIAITQLKTDGTLPADWQDKSSLSRTKDRNHGDFASNIAMLAAKAAGAKPRDLAEKIVGALPAHNDILKVEIAGAGFINFFLNDDQRFAILDQIATDADLFGENKLNAGKKVQVEFVSANPTSSLHVGHGRGAAYGMTVARLLEATGYDVQREYYVNDAGRQMDILATSTYLRYLERCGQTLTFPQNAYKGDYVFDIAQNILDQHGKVFERPAADVFLDVPADVVYGEKDSEGNPTVLSGDKEKHIDGLILNSQKLLGA
ncbi:MAG TPA: arginine--tRNA ligase, partial [Aquirhabdus sp.]